METSKMLQYVGSSALAAPRGESGDTVLEQVKDLVGRYPNLSEIELARLINLYRQLSALDMALMLSDETIAPSLDRFSKDHRSAVRPPFRQYAGLLAYAVLTIGAVIWAIIVATS
jgi:hypothetical protein